MITKEQMAGVVQAQNSRNPQRLDQEDPGNPLALYLRGIRLIWASSPEKCVDSLGATTAMRKLRDRKLPP